ncbi:hypothetical protein IVB03_39365 [Bradyrhizobium sp. 168]|uniref:hypothetical protein n=1 Tax=Bradyrhizobium sp. 168 TaxID=2782639 RepID=UPI001FF8DCC8|nr:hypothetical protein [Bradyrhizobium sp. 168]MCK1585455.1 hypothetical protein [Bradyrhizobium sp. 168]
MIPLPIAAIIVLTPLIVIGALIVAVSDRLKRRESMVQPHGQLAKAYAPTFVLIFAGLVVIGIAAWIL